MSRPTLDIEGAERLRDLAARRVFFLDRDGTLTLSERKLPHVDAFLAKLRATGRRFFVLTNNSSKSPRRHWENFRRMGLDVAEADVLVSFNGKAFDLPLLRTRFVLSRIEPPTPKPHLDLLHVARRLHKPRGIDCRLVSLEDRILGFVRHDDCPSGEVSGRYLHFLRTGDARSLLGVIEHNAWDVVTMAALVGLYGEPLSGTQLHPGDLVGVARTLTRARAHDDAIEAANLAVLAGVGPESLRARAEVQKARGDRDRALADLEALLAEAPCDRTRLDLAKLYEHYMKQPDRALDLVAAGTAEPEAAQAKRRARLERKRDARRQRELFPRTKAPRPPKSVKSG